MVSVGVCLNSPPGQLWVQEAELQGLSQLSLDKAESDKSPASSQWGLQLQGAQGQKGERL